MLHILIEIMKGTERKQNMSKSNRVQYDWKKSNVSEINKSKY